MWLVLSYFSSYVKTPSLSLKECKKNCFFSTFLPSLLYFVVMINSDFLKAIHQRNLIKKLYKVIGGGNSLEVHWLGLSAFAVVAQTQPWLGN